MLEKQPTHSKLKAQLATMLFIAMLGLPSTTRADVVTDWNVIATDNAPLAAACQREWRDLSWNHAYLHKGIHFRRTCTDGLRQGKKVGHFAFKHSLKPINQ